MTGAGAYARTQKETASRERLMVLLFEAALRGIRTAARALDSHRPSEATAALGRASDIVAEMMVTLDHRHAPELCKTLNAVYQFVLDRLLRAMTERHPRFAHEAGRALEPIVQGFAEVVQKLENAPRQPTP
jgi:flagellar protein FliS